MTDPVPSKEVGLTALMAWLRERHSYLVGLGAKETYEGLVHSHMESLQRTLRGIQSCSTCEACRGAATLALGDPLAAETRAATSRGAHSTEDAGRPRPCPEPSPVRAPIPADWDLASRLNVVYNRLFIDGRLCEQEEAEILYAAIGALRASEPPGAGQ